ncbi:MAG: hypothetical protein IT208_12080 [Chthonomonadales bacterium]|nr:hypothetical protein [Chthonomonadales bacterium]
MRTRAVGFLVGIIAAATLAGLWAAVLRLRAEAANRTVEIALDYDELRSLADVSGLAMPVVLARCRNADVTAVAVSEDTLSDLIARGELLPRRQGDDTLLTASSAATIGRVVGAMGLRGLRPATGRARATSLVRAMPCVVLLGPEGGPAAFPGELASLRALSVGLAPEALAAVRAAGLVPVARIANFPRASAGTMRAVLADLAASGVALVVMAGTETLGFRGRTPEAAEAFRATEVRWGSIEFGKQKGDEALARALGGAYVRVHSISEAEMGSLSPTEAVERFVRAARERNIRLCYVRLITMAGSDPLSENLDYVRAIERQIARRGEMTFGPAILFPPTDVPRWLFGVVALSAAAGLVLGLLRLGALGPGAALPSFLLLTLVCVGAALAPGETGRRLVALLAALVFPSLACMRGDVLGTPLGGPIAKRSGADFRGALAGLITVSAVTSLGVISVVGMLATRPFMLKASQFLGIKAAHGLPMLFIGALAVVGLPPAGRLLRDEWPRMRERIEHLLAEPVRLGFVVLGIVGLVAVVLALARTGNEPGVGVSGIELRFRSLLDALLPVRPRTKEMLIGHPALLVALAFRGRRWWAAPLFVLGVMGQVSLLNTFCHIHTPLLLSVVRALSGLVVGGAIGLAVAWVMQRLGARGSEELRPPRERATAGQG